MLHMSLNGHTLTIRVAHKNYIAAIAACVMFGTFCTFIYAPKYVNIGPRCNNNIIPY